MTIGGDTTDQSRKNIFIECGVHAREWISAASCRYFIYQLLAAAEDDLTLGGDLSYDNEDLKGLLDFNWHIIPHI